MHIHFASDDEQDDAGPSTSAAAAAYAPPQPETQNLPADASFACVASVRTDFDQNDQCYVLDLVYSQATGMVAAPLSNKLVKLYRFRWAAWCVHHCESCTCIAAIAWSIRFK